MSRIAMMALLALAFPAAARSPEGDEAPATAPADDPAVEAEPAVEIEPVEAEPVEVEPAAEAPTPAAPAPEPPPPPVEDDFSDETVLVVSDPFARWDGTRWFIKTEIGVPLVMTFLGEENIQFRTHAFQVRTILACEKDWKLSKRLYEVTCTIEDFGIQAVAHEKQNDHVLEVLEELDAKITGAELQLQVTDNGRVANIGLEGVPKDNRRLAGIHETIRLVMSRVVVGFDMRLQKWNSLQPGLWTEYSSKLMTMPVATWSQQEDRMITDNPTGSSVLLHKLDRMEGHLIVESRGKGVISTMGSSWMTEFSGVSVYDADDGYMTERVWSLSGDPTASSWVETSRYWHSGRVVQLGPDEKPSVGPTRQVSWPGTRQDDLAMWEPLEAPRAQP